jgi:hypothetical protein
VRSAAQAKNFCISGYPNPNWLHGNHIGNLRKQAAAKKKTLIITFYPDMNSMEDEGGLYDIDELMKVDFIDVPKK